MGFLTTLYLIISGILLFFLVFPFVTVFISRFVTERVPQPEQPKDYDFGCIITAYRNSNITKPLVHSLLKQQYKNFHIYLVADGCDVSDYNIEHEKFTLLRPDPQLNLKAKSIIHGMENYVREHDYTCIFDGDNLAHPDFLKMMNKYANAGHRSIQGQRTAKNIDSTYAAMDALGEFYKNYIERLVTYLIGSSSVISGSGMAVKTDLYWAYLKSPEIEQGKHQWKKMLQEDKILQNFLLKQNERIVYAWDAVCYDEKVDDGDAVETQRSRWLFSYFQNLPNSTGILAKGLFGLSWNQFIFGLVTVAPPLFIMVGLSGLMMILGFFIHLPMGIALFVGLAIFSLTVLWTIKLSDAPQAVWKAVWSLPLFVLKQFKGLLKMGNPNKNFKHTEHTKNVSVEDVLSKKL